MGTQPPQKRTPRRIHGCEVPASRRATRAASTCPGGGRGGGVGRPLCGGSGGGGGGGDGGTFADRWIVPMRACRATGRCSARAAGWRATIRLDRDRAFPSFCSSSQPVRNAPALARTVSGAAKYVHRLESFRDLFFFFYKWLISY